MFQKIIGDSLYSKFADNLDIHNYISSKIKEKRAGYYEHIDDEKIGTSWTNFVDFKGSMNELIYGCKEKNLYYLDNLKDLKCEDNNLDSVFFDIEGFAFEIGSVVEGVPEDCLNFNSFGIKPKINIISSYSFPWNTDEEKIKMRGVAIMNLINTLLSRGYIVNFKIVEIYHHDCSFKVKGQNLNKSIFELDIPLDVLSMSKFCFYNSVEFFRVIMILLHSILIDRPQEAGEGVGVKSYEEIFELYGKETFYIPNGYIDENFGKMETQKEFDNYIMNLFNNFCKGKENVFSSL